MSKKSTIKKSPRKFSDKIALIKQKEALTNACFESAIQSLSEITMQNHDFVQNAMESSKPHLSIETLPVTMDLNNSKSGSPASFISNSSGYSHDSPTNTVHGTYSFHQNMDSKDYVESEMTNRSNSYLNTGKYRESDHSKPSNTNTSNNTNTGQLLNVYSNWEGSSQNYRQNTLSHVLSDSQFHGGSMPNVSVIENTNNINNNNSQIDHNIIPMNNNYSQVQQSRHFNENLKNTKRCTPDTINMHEVLSNFEDVKNSVNGKKAILEHLKNKAASSFNSYSGPSNLTNSTSNLSNVHTLHPHHVSSPMSSNQHLHHNTNIQHQHQHQQHSHQDNISPMGNIYPSPTLPRKSGMHSRQDCASQMTDKGHLKHYSINNSPYLSILSNSNNTNNCVGTVSQQTEHNTFAIGNNSPGNGTYPQQNHTSNTQVNFWQIDTPMASTNDMAPSNHINQSHLNPSISSLVSADQWRRSSSDSNIQISLRSQCSLVSPQTANHQHPNPPSSFPIGQFSSGLFPANQQQQPQRHSMFATLTQLDNNNITNLEIAPTTSINPPYHRIQSMISYSEMDSSQTPMLFTNSQGQTPTLSQHPNFSASSSFIDRLLDPSSPPSASIYSGLPQFKSHSDLTTLVQATITTPSTTTAPSTGCTMNSPKCCNATSNVTPSNFPARCSFPLFTDSFSSNINNNQSASSSSTNPPITTILTTANMMPCTLPISPQQESVDPAYSNSPIQYQQCQSANVQSHVPALASPIGQVPITGDKTGLSISLAVARSTSEHECWWAASKDPAISPRDSSIPVKPCDNLDLQSTPIDPLNDFASIPDIILNNGMCYDTERRDSVNWTDSILNNLSPDTLMLINSNSNSSASTNTGGGSINPSNASTISGLLLNPVAEEHHVSTTNSNNNNNNSITDYKNQQHFTNIHEI